MTDYENFIKSKQAADIPTGFDCDVPVGPLFDFQAACVKWALKRGRAALFLDTGLGKTLCQVTWAQKVHEHTGGNVIIAAPLCVAQQTVEEAAKFGITVKYCRDESQVDPGITITNYEMLEHFDLESFVGVVLDESSILKGQNSRTREFIVDAFRRTEYKLSCTATPSPNDWMELGNQAAFLGIMSSVEMLSTYFTHDGGDTGKWRLKGHGKVKFWEWMATWAICIRNPSDLGFDGSRYQLPALTIHEHQVSGGELMEGQLFAVVAQSLSERREAKRNSMADRIETCKLIVERMNGLEAGVCGNKEVEGEGRSGVQGKEKCSIDFGPGSAQEVHQGVSIAESGKVEADSGGAGKSERGTSGEVCGECGIPGSCKGESGGMECEQPKREKVEPFEEIRTDSGDICGASGVAQSPVRDLRTLGKGKREDVSDDRSLPHNRECARDTLRELQSSTGEVQGQHPITGISNQISKKQPCLIWCHLNDEQDALEKMFGDDCFSVRGAMSPDEKEKAVMGWLHGERPIMISKASILGFGLNFQHCQTMIFVGMDDSFEKYYQAVRRCWRFGQTKPVSVHIITAETEGAVKANIERKQRQANEMAGEMVTHMRAITTSKINGATSNTEVYRPTVAIQIPAWINKNIEVAA